MTVRLVPVSFKAIHYSTGFGIRMSDVFRTYTALIFILCLSGCSLFGKKNAPSEMEIKPAPHAATLDFIAVASPLINPSSDGVPSPVAIRLYQLKGETVFSNASFKQLWEQDEKTLGPTLLAKTELYLAPGSVQRIKANLIEGTVIVAVVVGYRNFETAKWRAMVPLQGDTYFQLKANLKTLSVELGPQN